MMIHKAITPRDDIDRGYVSRKGGESVLVRIEDCVDVTIRGLEEYTKKIKERLIKADSYRISNIKTCRKTKTNKKEQKKYEEKQLCR